MKISKYLFRKIKKKDQKEFLQSQENIELLAQQCDGPDDFATLIVNGSQEEITEKLKDPILTPYERKKYRSMHKQYKDWYETYESLGVFNHFSRITNQIKRNEILLFLIEKLDIVGYRKVEDNTWYTKEGFGGRGYEFALANGNVLFLDIGVAENNVYLPQILLKEKGKGDGTRVMNALQEFVEGDHGVFSLYVYKVTNHSFFQKFSWLKQANQLEYQFKKNLVA